MDQWLKSLETRRTCWLSLQPHLLYHRVKVHTNKFWAQLISERAPGSLLASDLGHKLPSPFCAYRLHQDSTDWSDKPHRYHRLPPMQSAQSPLHWHLQGRPSVNFRKAKAHSPTCPSCSPHSPLSFQTKNLYGKNIKLKYVNINYIQNICKEKSFKTTKK